LEKHNVKVPLMLGIQGPSGDGKSWQTRVICAELNLPVIRVSAATLSSRWEGVPAELVKEAYRFAASQNQGYAVLLIDDFDTSPASIKDRTQYTVNSQLLCGALMNIADDPNHISGEELNRIPIILTGNDFTSLYSPLTRIGRMTIFSWAPNIEERKQILKSIFPRIQFNEEQLEQLVSLKIDGRRQVPISFYDEIKRNLWETSVWKVAENCTFKDAKSILSTISQQIQNDDINYYSDDILQLAKELQSEHILQNFLK
jgi:ATP-dependent 26S proteasome regulatory subunit